MNLGSTDLSPVPPGAPGPGWLKADFHLHTREDPKDFLDYSALDLLKKAHALGFRLLAITLHDRVLNDPAVHDAAREYGIRLIPSAELRLEGADVVILNLTPEEAADLRRLSDLEAFRRRRGNSALIIAPHPFYVLGGSMGRRLFELMHLIDAVEICHFHSGWFNLNRRAIQAAGEFRKPLVATSDAHRLEGFGRAYTYVQAAVDAPVETLFGTIRDGGVHPVSPDMTAREMARQFWWMYVQHKARKWQALRARKAVDRAAAKTNPART